MKMAACPVCSSVHEAVGAGAVGGAVVERTYRINRCRFCESPSTAFRQLPNQPERADDELGYPMAVVPWLDAGVQRRADKQRAKTADGDGAGAGASPGPSVRNAAVDAAELSRLKATRGLLGGSKLFRHQLQTKLDVHLALCKGIPDRCKRSITRVLEAAPPS